MLDRYKKEIWEREKKIDPYQDEDWSSMALGWALANGMPPGRARDFAFYVTSKVDFEKA